MRDFEERMAEIYRRSDQIIRQRKKRRKYALMACIPLVLCLTLLAGLALPSMMPTTAKDGAAAPENMMSDSSESHDASVWKIQVSSPGRELTHTQPSEILEISGYINRCILEAPKCGENVIVDHNIADMENFGIALTGHTVTLLRKNGRENQYYLEKNVLVNLQTNCAYSLSEGQLHELRTLLGIDSQ